MIIDTNIGAITLGYNNGDLFCEFGKHKVDQEPAQKLSAQLSEYFEGKKIITFDAPLPNGTPFTRKCWAACRNIPYGETITYKELAKLAGSPKAMRATGQAMRNNPLTIITPCHRVISSSGSLHGYSGATDPQSEELNRKKYLLDLEKGIMTS
jgi:methylated-DNA-[protein]-cysteine S-methyltransferase|tara:strand:- start:66 stop:524 length:459 start_codon:yes stop_codon:yes gene_type:complete